MFIHISRYIHLIKVRFSTDCFNKTEKDPRPFLTQKNINNCYKTVSLLFTHRLLSLHFTMPHTSIKTHLSVCQHDEVFLHIAQRIRFWVFTDLQRLRGRRGTLTD